MIKVDFEKLLQFSDGKHQLKVNFQLNKNEILAIYGPSGSGKSTILKIISGLITPDHGRIAFNNDEWYNSSSYFSIKPGKRNIGFVFQEFALFPNMSVKQNILFAKNDISFCEELLQLTDLKKLENKKPHQLSGGQQQRVALARALIKKPHLLLLDEPFSAIDFKLKKKLSILLKNITSKHPTTTLIASHHIHEILSLSSKLLVIENNTAVLYNKPGDYFENELNFTILEGEIIDFNGGKTTLKTESTVIDVKINDLNNSFKKGDIIKIKLFDFHAEIIKK